MAVAWSTPALIKSRTAERQKSWGMGPAYSYHSLPVFFPSPTLTHALFHSLRKFTRSNTGPLLRNNFLSIPTSSCGKGRASGLRFLTTPAVSVSVPFLLHGALRRFCGRDRH